jgi:hypothetical protein
MDSTGLYWGSVYSWTSALMAEAAQRKTGATDKTEQMPVC